MSMNKFECKRCGWCCKNVVINVSYSDIMGWMKKNRWDILKEVAWINNYPKPDTGGFYITKTAKNPKMPCPFLKTKDGMAFCAIEIIKPSACRDYPMGYAEFTDCPHFRKSNSKLNKQIKKRQYKDFKKAFDNHLILVNLLAKARRQAMVNG